MNCSDLMKKAIVYLNPEDTAQTAARLMADSNVGFLPVCEDGKAIGTVTDRDIALRIVREGKAATIPVRDIMTHDVIACGPDDSIEEAAEVMAEHQVSRLMINGPDGKLLGIISLSDLPRADAESAFHAFQDVTEREAHPS